MTAYFDGQHHPHQALAPRVGYVAVAEGEVVGYVAAHLTTRHGCQGEVQYLFVAPAFRRRGIARELIRLVAAWFSKEGAVKVCVCVDADSPAAEPFYAALGAKPIRRFWVAWENISIVRATSR